MGGTRAEAAVTGTARWPAASLGAPRDRAANLSGDRCATWAKSTEATRLSCRAFWTWSQDRLRPSQGDLSRRTAAQSSCSGSGHVGRQRLACSRSTHVFSSLGRRERSGRVARLTSAGVPGSRSSAPRLPPGRQPRPPARGDGTRLSEDLRRPPAKRSLGHRADARGLRRLGAPARHPHSDHSRPAVFRSRDDEEKPPQGVGGIGPQVLLLQQLTDPGAELPQLLVPDLPEQGAMLSATWHRETLREDPEVLPRAVAGRPARVQGRPPLGGGNPGCHGKVTAPPMTRCS